MIEENRMNKGKVYLIGAGPGDPELLTLKGKRCLETADVIVGDYLADRRILRFANPAAEYIYVGKQSGNHTMTQEEISCLLAEKGKQGKVVARLKGGDPFVFGRGGEEIEVLKEAGVPFEEVPGITSAIAAPAYAGIPVTHRKVAASFAVVTGHEDPTKGRSDVHFDKLAGAVDTLIFLMGVGRVKQIAEELIKNGRSADTPAAFIRWGTRPYQETYTTTLGEAEEAVKRFAIKPPAVFVVGEVVNLRETLQWYDNKPLFGKHILITRSRTQASRMTKVLEDLGAFCTEISSIKIEIPGDGWKSIDKGIEHVKEYDWIVFTSQNGVDAFFGRLNEKGLDSRALGCAKIAVIGPATDKQLRRYGLKADCVPEKYKAEDLLEAMKQLIKPGEKIFLPRAKVARSVLPDGLVEAGCTVDVVEAYQTVCDVENKEKLKDLLIRKEVDIITFTSSSTVHNLIGQIEGKTELLENVSLACIGPITADACREYHLNPDIISDVFTIEGLAGAIVKGVDR